MLKSLTEKKPHHGKPAVSPAVSAALASAMDEPDLVTEAELSPGIQFPMPASPHALSPRAVCMTGATGFLGAYLLDEILTKTGAEAHCLVRASNTQAAFDRLARNLSSYGLWREEFAPRIHPLPIRDLAEPRFGLDDNEFGRLAAETDAIYHSAGSLNMTFPYKRLKPANVEGTINVLRLAGAVHTKPVHFLSSMVVFFSDAHTHDELLRESDPPRCHSTLKGGYGKSKWVADRLVADAQRRGLPATIHRPVRTMGHSETGALNELDDILPTLLKGCILMGTCPSLDLQVTMVPVDIVTRSMVHLAGRRESWGQAFHYFHPAPVEWGRMMDILRNLGYPVKELDYRHWRREVKQRMSSGNETPELKQFFGALLFALTSPHFLFYKRPPMDASQLLDGVAGTGFAYPEIDESLMGIYLNYWRKIGYVPSPPASIP